jgi:outer membrane lipopolysaccharide assembly protein LptE/RlpB
MARSNRNRRFFQRAKPVLAAAALLFFLGCGYRFGGAPSDNPYPPELKTILLESAVNTTTITGIETELTNDLRQEFALGTRMKAVRSGGDVVLKTVITDYSDTPSTYRADGKELTRMGTLKVACALERSDNKKVLWQKDVSASYPYNVTDTISGTLTNRRQAISKMIKDLIPSIHRSMYDNF